jgi:Lon protease-like protein
MSVPERAESDFPLFPLELVALPTEAVPLHIFEERYKTMVSVCIAEDREFGIVWLAEDGLREIGCACRVEEVLEQLDDGRLNILARGTRALRVIERQGHLAYPAGLVELVSDVEEEPDEELAAETRSVYGELVKLATEHEPGPEDLAEMGAFAMVATVEFGLDTKQGLLELRSENARLGLALRLFRAATKRLEFVDRAQVRAKSNGIVRFN